MEKINNKIAVYEKNKIVTLQTKEQKEFEPYFTNRKDIKLLNKRQLECLSLYAYGLSNSRISKVLFMSESTVKKTFEDMFRKIG